MIDISQKPNQSSKLDSSELTNILKVGIYLSFLAVSLLLILIFVEISVEVQQIVVVVIGLLLFASFSAFKKIINPQKDTFLDQFRPYLDNRTVTSNTYYQGDTYYNRKQNLADAVEEIQGLLDKLSKTYDESPIDKSKIDVNLIKSIENIEIKRNEKLTDKERIIVAQAVEEIDRNQRVKEHIIEAIKLGEEEALKLLSPYMRIVIDLLF